MVLVFNFNKGKTCDKNRTTKTYGQEADLLGKTLKSINLEKIIQNNNKNKYNSLIIHDMLDFNLIILK